jgi:fructose-specific phosphotransferase system IIA component
MGLNLTMPPAALSATPPPSKVPATTPPGTCFFTMRLTDILKLDNVKLPIKAEDKTAVIEELITLLDANGDLEDTDKVRKAVLDRERTRTTGIGDGLAIPHGKTDGVKNLVMAFGRCQSPVDFEAIDGKPVSLVWLLSSPSDKTVPHINALARISKIMAKADVRKKLMSVKTTREIYDIVSEEDEKL